MLFRSGPGAGAKVPQGEPAAGVPGPSPDGGPDAYHLGRGDMRLDELTLERDARLRERSGAVSSRDPLACLLYVLARDHVPVALLESVVDELDAAPGALHHYSNGYLAGWALDAAARVRSAETPPASEIAT